MPRIDVDVDVFGRPAFPVVVAPEGRYLYDGINAALTVQCDFNRLALVDNVPEDCMPASARGSPLKNYHRCFTTGAMHEYEE